MKNKEKEINNYFLTLTKTNRALKNYVDWDKVKTNTEIHKMNLSQLNLFTKAKNKKDIKLYIKQLFDANRSDVFNSLEILIAKRDGDKEYFDEKTLEINNYSFETQKDVFDFIEGTNLLVLFSTVRNLEDYVFGVEVGMDVNARKNRGGDVMEYTVRKLLLENEIDFQEQVHLKDIPDISGNHKKIKKVDFLFEKNGITYLVESSFYNSQGSKISETCNSYVDLTNKLDSKYKMIWVADGKGMLSILNLLKEQWNNVKILNIKQFESLLK